MSAIKYVIQNCRYQTVTYGACEHSPDQTRSNNMGVKPLLWCGASATHFFITARCYKKWRHKLLLLLLTDMIFSYYRQAWANRRKSRCFPEQLQRIRNLCLTVVSAAPISRRIISARTCSEFTQNSS